MVKSATKESVINLRQSKKAPSGFASLHNCFADNFSSLCLSEVHIKQNKQPVAINVNAWIMKVPFMEISPRNPPIKYPNAPATDEMVAL